MPLAAFTTELELTWTSGHRQQRLVESIVSSARDQLKVHQTQKDPNDEPTANPHALLVEFLTHCDPSKSHDHDDEVHQLPDHLAGDKDYTADRGSGALKRMGEKMKPSRKLQMRMVLASGRAYVPFYEPNYDIFWIASSRKLLPLILLMPVPPQHEPKQAWLLLS